MRNSWHTRPRVQRAPGIPCALCFERDNEFAKLGRNAPRECELMSTRHPEVRALRCTCTAGRASKDESAAAGPPSFEARQGAHLRMTDHEMRFTAQPIQPPDPTSFFPTHSTSRETKSPPLRSPVAAVMIAAEQHGQARFDMAKMRAIDAAVRMLEKEGVTQAFGVPGAAINPLYSALKRARLDQPHPGAPRRGRLAHGRGLHPRQGRQYRRLHRHLGPGRHRHDHRALFGASPIRSRSSASPARRRARGSTRKTSRRSTSSRSPSR